MKTTLLLVLCLCLTSCAYWAHTYEKIIYEAVYNDDGSRKLDGEGNPAWKEIRKYTYASYHGGDTTYISKRAIKKDTKTGEVIEEVEEDTFIRGISKPLMAGATAAAGAVETLGSGL